MKEKPAYDSNEEDPNEDDGLTKKSKKTTKIARHLPLGLDLGSEKIEARPEKPRLSISERLLQQMEEAKNKSTEQDKDANEPKEVEEATDSTFSPPPAEVPVETKATGDALEATDWSAEGEIEGEDGEIDLSKAVDESAAEPTEEFVEIPPEPVEDDTAIETAPVEPELLATGLAAEGAPELPEETEPTVREHPVSTGIEAAARPWYNATEADRARHEHAQELNDAEYYAEKRGVRRGLGAGLAFGWLFGRHGKKKAQKEHKQQMSSKDKEIKNLKVEQSVAAERLEAVKRTQEQLSSNIRTQELKRAGEASDEAQRPLGAGEQAEITKKTPEASVLTAAGAALILGERMTAVAAENRPASTRSVNAEKLPEDQAITEETYQSADGRRIETSAWHRIEVDEKTGKPVDDPEVAYGEEFQRERRQEILKRGSNGGGSSSASALGGLAASATTDNVQDGVDEPNTEKWDGSLEVPKPEFDSPHEHLTAGNELLRHTSKPITWAIAIVIVIVLFVLGILR